MKTKKRYNIVFIMTDTQRRDMVGCYGNKGMDTPNLDRLAEEGIRFDRAYTTCPVCTPARGAIFSGLNPQINGAYCNNLAPHRHVPLMGEVFRHFGYRAAYTGKWHLDGAGYFGDGLPGGGFEKDWWFDGKNYADTIGPDMFSRYRHAKTSDNLREWGFVDEKIWGHHVANRAVDFLQSVGNDPFVLAVSFDEPHEPYVAPPHYWENFDPRNFPQRPNFLASLEGKPELHQWHAMSQNWPTPPPEWASFADGLKDFLGCNSFIDREIGRVLEAIDHLHKEDTIVIYTSDHGDMLGSHQMRSKGPMMYEEITNIPFIVRFPDCPQGAVSKSLVSHLDIMPTVLDFAGIEIPDSLQGVSLRPVLENPLQSIREHAMISWNRFAINHDSYGEFFPIRCIVTERYKLALNLFDRDEFYDLEEDPYEMCNLIDQSNSSKKRDLLHDILLDEMDRIRDTFRSFHWSHRVWRNAPRDRNPYKGAASRRIPRGFSFQPGELA